MKTSQQMSELTSDSMINKYVNVCRLKKKPAMKRNKVNSNVMKLLYICKIYFDRFIRITYRSLFDYRAPGDH